MSNLKTILSLGNEKFHEYGISLFLYATLKVFGFDKIIDKFIIKKYDYNKNLPTTKPLVSVIVPVFNGEKFGLEKLLLSLKNQTYKNIEIIAIDSGSTDNTLNILKNYQCKILKINKDKFRHDYARNLGAMHAKGKYLLFTVQDANFVNKNYVSTAVSILESNPKIISFSAKQKAKENASLYAKFLSEFFPWANGYRYEYNIIGNEMFSKLKFLIRHDQLGRFIHLDNTNHLTRKDFFLKNQYSVNTCEDMEYSKKILFKNLYFVYSNVDYIEHSHEYKNYFKYFQRVFVDTQTIYKLIGIKESFLKVNIENVISDYLYTVCKIVNYQLYLIENDKDVLNIKPNDILDIECNLSIFLEIKDMINVKFSKYKINKEVFYQYMRFFQINYNFIKNNFNLNNYSLEEIKDTLLLIFLNFLAHKISYYHYVSINKQNNLRKLKWV